MSEFFRALVEIIDPRCFWVLGLAAVIYAAGLNQEWWVRGKEFRRKAAECDKWMDIAIPGLQISQNLVEAVKREA